MFDSTLQDGSLVECKPLGDILGVLERFDVFYRPPLLEMYSVSNIFSVLERLEVSDRPRNRIDGGNTGCEKNCCCSCLEYCCVLHFELLLKAAAGDSR